MDVLGSPAAIHGRKLAISRATKDASPNILTDPEISMENLKIDIVAADRSLPSSLTQLYLLVPI